MSKNNINLEDLLKLKQKEMPNEEFWTNFDAQLKSKMILQTVDNQKQVRSKYAYYCVGALSSMALAVSFCLHIFSANIASENIEASLVAKNQIAIENLSEIDFSNINYANNSLSDNESYSPIEKVAVKNSYALPAEELNYTQNTFAMGTDYNFNSAF